MARKDGLSTAQVIEALRKTFGNLSMTAKQLGVTRQAIQYYVQTYPTVQQAMEEAAQSVSDKAESNIVLEVMRGDLKASTYWLENKARDRGYGRQAADTSLSVSVEELATLSDEELDALAAKLDRLGGKK
jgi:hypothetical protein